jgi:hypothetical protein
MNRVFGHYDIFPAPKKLCGGLMTLTIGAPLEVNATGPVVSSEVSPE